MQIMRNTAKMYIVKEQIVNSPSCANLLGKIEALDIRTMLFSIFLPIRPYFSHYIIV